MSTLSEYHTNTTLLEHTHHINHDVNTKFINTEKKIDSHKNIELLSVKLMNNLLDETH